MKGQQLILIRLLGVAQAGLVGLQSRLHLILNVLSRLLAGSQRQHGRVNICLGALNGGARAVLRSFQILLGAVERDLGRVDLRLGDGHLLGRHARHHLLKCGLLLRQRRRGLIHRRLQVGGVELGPTSGRPSPAGQY